MVKKRKRDKNIEGVEKHIIELRMKALNMCDEAHKLIIEAYKLKAQATDLEAWMDERIGTIWRD
jgi:hypothetical protein